MWPCWVPTAPAKAPRSRPSGLVNAERGKVAHGSIHYQGQNITNTPASDFVQQGLVQVLDGRHCFAHLTIEENLHTGAFVRKPSAKQIEQLLEKIYHYFPRLRKLRKNQAG